MAHPTLKLDPDLVLQHKNAHENVTVVASGKGGVGKTWCAITLASLAAKSGKKVLLFDGDIGLANIDIQLGLNPKHDLYDILSKKCEIEAAITKLTEDTGYHKFTLDVLSGRSGSGMLATLSQQQYLDVLNLFQEFVKTYDHIVIDLGAGVDQSLRNIAKIGKNQVIVTTTEPTALTDAYAYVKIMHQYNPNFNFKVLINRCPNEQAGLRTYETLKKACENYLKVVPKLAGIIEEDSNILQSIKMQKSTTTAFPTSKCIQQLTKIQEALFS